MKKLSTPLGKISESFLKEFNLVSGLKFTWKDWIIQSDECEYWQLVDPGSTVEARRWKKKPGLLPIRYYNFRYACYKCPKIITDTSGKKIQIIDIEKAIKYAREKLFKNEKPIYLPEYLAEVANPMRDDKEKPSKSYKNILDEEKELFERFNK